MTDNDWRERTDARLGGIENRLIAVETKNAVDEVHRENVEKRLGAIEGTLKQLMWLVISGIVVGLLAFIMNGGLTLVSS